MSAEVVTISRDDAALEYTLGARMDLARKLLSQPPETTDPKDISNALKALDGIDKQVINKKRLVLEDKAANENAKAARLIADVLRGVQGARPYESPVPVEREIPMLPDFDEPLQLVPGETDINAQQGSYEEFMAKQA